MMRTFSVVKFDDNGIADAACKELFSASLNSKKKKKSNSKVKIIKKRKNETLHNKKVKNKIKDVYKNGKRIDTETNNLVNMKKPKQIKDNISERKYSDKKEQKGEVLKKKHNKISENIILTKSENQEQRKQKNKRLKKVKVKSNSEQNNSEENVQNNTEINTKIVKHNNQFQLIPEFPRKTKTIIENSKQKRRKEETLKQIQTATPKKQKPISLREKMMEKLKSARFRFLNEHIYSSDGKEAEKLFKSDPESFKAYHEGYRQQVNKWPLNPVDIIIKSIQKLPKSHIIADFGCGDAKLEKSVSQKVHSFDLIATNELVVACNMAHVPLQKESVDVVVFCLSLMGTNLGDYLLEANRVLKKGGILKIAEVESRFEDINQFIEGLRRFHFKNTWKDLSHNLFYFLDFKKESNIQNKKKLPTISLHPCLYKKR